MLNTTVSPQALAMGLFLIHLAATLVMTGIIWFVQVVHYPLFNQVGTDEFITYANLHRHLTTLVVAGPMVVEALTGVLLLYWTPTPLPLSALLIGMAFIGVIWLATLFFSIPNHAILSGGYDAQAHQTLVTANWIRTISWSLRSMLVLWLAWKLCG